MSLVSDRSIKGEIFKQEEFTFTHATELREMLQYYYNIDVLKPGQSTLLKIPGDIKKPTTFYCPVFKTVRYFFAC